MRPGSLLLFIDNEIGCFHELMMHVAFDHGFESIFGTHRGTTYVNNSFKVKRFGINSCYKTTVTVHVLRKPDFFPYNPNAYPILPYKQALMPLPLPRSNFLYQEDGEFEQDTELNVGFDFGCAAKEKTPPEYALSRISPYTASESTSSHYFNRSNSYKKKSRSKKGCLPLRMRSFRRHIKSGLTQFKAYARAPFIKRQKRKTY